MSNMSNMSNIDKIYLEKYVKYKYKYLTLKKQKLLYGGDVGSCELCFTDNIELDDCMFNCDTIKHKFCTGCTLSYLLSAHFSSPIIRCPKCNATKNSDKIFKFSKLPVGLSL